MTSFVGADEFEVIFLFQGYSEARYTGSKHILWPIWKSSDMVHRWTVDCKVTYSSLCHCKCSLFINIGLSGPQHPLEVKYFLVIVDCILFKNIVGLTCWYMEGVVVLKAQYKVKSSDTAIVISEEAGPQKEDEEMRNGSASVEEKSKSPRRQKVLQGELYFRRGPEGKETQTEVSKEGTISLETHLQ